MSLLAALRSLNMKCREASELISGDMDEHPQTVSERAGLCMHLVICGPCRAFRRQLAALRGYLRDPDTPRLPEEFLDAKLSDDARAKLARVLDEAAGRGD